MPRQLRLAPHGTVFCDAAGTAKFSPVGAEADVRMALTNCSGGQDGTPLQHRAAMAVATGWAHFHVELPSSACAELTAPTAPSSIAGTVRWYDTAGRTIGASTVADQPFDTRGAVVRLGGAFPLERLAIRWTPDVTACTGSAGSQTVPLTGGHLTVFPQFG